MPLNHVDRNQLNATPQRLGESIDKGIASGERIDKAAVVDCSWLRGRRIIRADITQLNGSQSGGRSHFNAWQLALQAPRHRH